MHSLFFLHKSCPEHGPHAVVIEALSCGCGCTGTGGDLGAWLALPCNAGADNARFLKAAVMAGFYPSVLRVQHPPTQYLKVSHAPMQPMQTQTHGTYAPEHTQRSPASPACA